jgi:hypothetical protein
MTILHSKVTAKYVGSRPSQLVRMEILLWICSPDDGSERDGNVL